MENNLKRNKMTAVEWLISKIEVNSNPSLTQKEMIGYIEQAKEMEKQQIIDAQSYAISKADMTNNRGFFDCEQYYNDKFNLS
jgi:hypothetical protein